MMPPCCQICHLDFDPGQGGEIVTFARTDSDRQWDRDAQQEGFAGHPPYAAWFCKRHQKRAEALRKKGLTLTEALGNW